MKVDSPLPSFPVATLWLNHVPDPRALKGHPTLVHFLSLHSEIDRLNLSHVTALRDSRKHEGFRVIGVVVPLTEAEESTQFASESIARLNLTEPCALDVDHNLRKAFETKKENLPVYYLFDINGRLRCVSTGEQGVMTIEDELDRMLVELRETNPFCPSCELFFDRQAMFCSECGIPLSLPGAKGSHPYYENHHVGSLPTVRLANPDPLIGKVIDGKYELVAKLGEGGMSVVYRARRAHIGDIVAVKILLRKFISDEIALTRFRREARAAAMLHHPNVVTIHDFGETGDENAPAYIVMEFIKGTPLRELLEIEKKFSVDRGLRLMRGVCAGVGTAHRHGVVHRDLKPDNIIVVAPDADYEFETVRVLDFGLAKVLADSGGNASGAIVGTVFYMSPEQCLGNPLDARSDVYSLGAMLYEMLAGQRPFTAETVSGVVSKQLTEEPAPLSPALEIPRRVAAAIMRALAKDPDDRPQTAIEFGRML